MLCSERIFPLAGPRSEFKLLWPSKCEPKHFLSLARHTAELFPHKRSMQRAGVYANQILLFLHSSGVKSFR
jgi:hypothetical protein